MWFCPVPSCKKECKNAGAKQHMTKMHPDWVLVDAENMIYRAPDEAPKMETAFRLKVRTPKNSPTMRKLRLPVSVSKPDPPSPEKKVEIQRRTIKVKTKKKKPSIDYKAMASKLKERIPKKERKPRGDPDPNWDPEPTLEIVTKIPLFMIIIIVAYKYFTDPGFFMQFLDNDVVEIYKYVFMDITSPGALIILALTIVIVLLLVFLIYKMVWRFMFKDLQIRKGFTQGTDKYRKGPGTSFEGRIMLVVGDGFWDRIYRRYTKRPKPDIMTIFFRRGFRDPAILNPFKVLASCHKGRLDNTNGDRYIRDGLFKRTVVATHLRRDTEAESTVYWFEDKLYESKQFDADWYTNRLKGTIKEDLSKVSKACLMDSTTQKAQMANVISWLPMAEIDEQERVWELKKEAKAKLEIKEKVEEGVREGERQWKEEMEAQIESQSDK